MTDKEQLDVINNLLDEIIKQSHLELEKLEQQIKDSEEIWDTVKLAQLKPYFKGKVETAEFIKTVIELG